MKHLPITLEALQVLDAIELHGSFAKAAEALGKAPSALSYIVQRLEEQLDVTIFTREGRRSVLTNAGRVVLEEGRLILDATSRLSDKAKEVASGWEPRLKVSVSSNVDYDQFFKVLDTFLEDHPGIEIDVREHVLNGGWDVLEHDIVDLVFGVIGPVPAQKGFRTVQMDHFEMILVVAPEHPLANTSLRGDELSEEISKYRRVVQHDTVINNIPRSAGLTTGRQVLYVQNMDQKIAAQVAGLGVGHLPKRRIASWLESGRLVQLPIQMNGDEKSYIAWKVSNRGKGLLTLAGLLESACGL